VNQTMVSAQALVNRRIILVVTGGVAAYKSAELTRLLIKRGAAVQVVMTEGAKAFIHPLTFQALSGRGVRDSLLDPSAEMGMGHIELARWGEMILVAPATADAIAKLATGLADDLFSTIALARKGRLVLAPAMNQSMWSNPFTQANISRLTEIDPTIVIWGPDTGEQACGDVGPGRMLEPAELVRLTVELLCGDQPLLGRRVVLTAGPTRERLDPVRYISNDSSGKMGYSLAAAMRQAGAEVVLVSGPVPLPAPAGVQLVSVESARQMQTETLAVIAQGCDIFVATAAVADYRPVTSEDQKIKKSADNLSIDLIKNPDILAEVAVGDHRPFCVGFAAETQNIEDYARQKLVKKNVDIVIANDVSRSDIGFNSDHNAVTIITADNTETLPRLSKVALAEQLVQYIAKHYKLSL